MKKSLLMALVLASAFQAHAYNCSDKVTGAEAGKFEEIPTTDGSQKITYMSNRTTTEGWELLVANNGNLYNADMMVQNGKDVLVGKLEMKSYYFALTLNGRQLVCE